ncbi:MAG: CRISPR-associated endoribonuclease Cas6 [Clostridia bacterium]|nr:CRISPR-associated endoribonuclease Cas6 [Clostridia bacterium]
MKYFEIRVTSYLKKDVMMKNVGEVLSKHINYCMSKSDFLYRLHEQKIPKLYCYDYMFPLEKGKKYDKGRVYVFRIRTPMEKIASEMRRTLTTYETDFIKPLGLELRVKKFTRVEELYTLTPVVATINKKNWTREDSMDIIWKMIDNNLEKKCKMIFGEAFEIKESSIEFLEIKNNKTIVVDYKGGKVLGNKFSMRFKSDELSQKMAYAALASGLLEKSSSIGAGFCKIVKRG